MTEVLRPNAHRVALIVGCEKLEVIARAAGVPGNIPAVKSIADVHLMKLITGGSSPHRRAAVARHSCPRSAGPEFGLRPEPTWKSGSGVDGSAAIYSIRWEA